MPQGLPGTDQHLGEIRPELEKALALAHQSKEAAPETPVILTVHELKRLARNAAELMTLSAELQADGIQLELLTGPLTGIYDPNGMGAMFFAVLAVAGQIERNYMREKTLEGQVIAASKGNHGGRPKVIDGDMLTFAVALKDKGVPVPEIAKKLTIKTGKNASKSPSASVGPRTRSTPRRSTCASGSKPSPTRTPQGWSAPPCRTGGPWGHGPASWSAVSGEPGDKYPGRAGTFRFGTRSGSRSPLHVPADVASVSRGRTPRRARPSAPA
ncbi:recombinase family protein [Streptomyces olivaceus]|uniref:recombinase family protein n=1 Tax=Streptomyces olivaceus TaxID=47716 RepID=UPI0037FB47C0